MTASARAPSERERENNKRRERRRRAVQSRMFTCLRHDDDLNLPKHCDNNEVLKALCRRAGYIVEEDGTTFKPRCQRREGVCDGMQFGVDCWQPRPCATSVHMDSPAPFSDIASANGYMSANTNASTNLTALRSIPHPVRGEGSFSAPVTPPLSSPRGGHPISRPHDTLPDILLSKSDLVQSNLSQSSPPSRGDSPLSNAEGANADPRFDAENGRMHSNIPKIKYLGLASHRSGVHSTADLMLPRAPLELASFAPDSTAEFTVFKNCNPFFASSSSTPTYATSRLVSGTSTPSCFYTSGTCTPAQSSRYSSGACTPTSNSHAMRALPIHFAVAISNLALSQSQEDVQDEERAASDAPQCKKPSGLSTPPLPRRGMAVLESTPEGLPGSNSNMYGNVCDPPRPMHALTEVVPDGRGTKMDTLKRHGLVKPWEGETIHEVSLGEEELELTLGSAAWRSKPGC